MDKHESEVAEMRQLIENLESKNQTLEEQTKEMKTEMEEFRKMLRMMSKPSSMNESGFFAVEN